MNRAAIWWHRWRIAVLALSVALLLWLTQRFATRILLPPSCDFLQYWAAARLNLAGKNPFAVEHVRALWQAAGWQEPSVLVMPNPPLVLTLMTPWALINARTSWVLWQVCLGVGVLLSADSVWRHYGGPPSLRWAGWAIGVLFVPAIIAVRSGQLGPVVLLGVVLFLLGVESRQRRASGEWLAAAAIPLIAAKPHLVYLFWVALVLWCVTDRRWTLLGKAAVCTIATLVFPMLTNPEVLAQYVTTIWQRPPDQWLSATWGSHLRLALGWERFWLQFAPSALVGVCYAVYAWHRARRWDWGRELPVLVLAALVTRPFGWTHDLVLAVLPLTAIAAQAAARGGNALLRACACYVVLDVLVLLAYNLAPPGDHRLVWLPVSIAACYGLMAFQSRRRAPSLLEGNGCGNCTDLR